MKTLRPDPERHRDQPIEGAETLGDRLDSLKFQLQEFASLPIESIDFEQIDAEHRRLANASELREMATRLTAILQDDETSALGLLASAEGIAQELAHADKSCTELGELLSGGRIQLEEASEWIRQYTHNIEPDPERLQQLDEVLSQAHKLSKKHRVDPNGLAELQAGLSAEYDQLQGMDESLESLQQACDAALKSYREVAAKLTAKRRKAATTLAGHLTRSMQSLGMKNGKFEIAMSPGRSDKPSIHGNDAVVFKVSANPGAPPLPMSDVASARRAAKTAIRASWTAALVGAASAAVCVSSAASIGIVSSSVSARIVSTTGARTGLASG